MTRRNAPLSLLPATAALLLATIPLGAQESQAPQDDFSASAGVALFWSETAIVGADDQVLPIPFFSVKWGSFYFKGIEAGVELPQFAGIESAIALRGEFASWDASDSDYLEGMDDRDPTMEVGLKARTPLGEGFVAEAAIWADALDVHGGWQAELTLARPLRLAPQWILEPSIGASLISEDKADYYYGVPTAEARTNRPAYTPGSTVEYTGSLFLRYFHSETLFYFAGLSATFLPEEISDSPIVDDDLLLGGGIGVVWNF